jgi:glycosyltransferase involved in cell wall biosynthesis
MRRSAWSDPPRSATGWIERTLFVRVAINVEQLFYRAPGGTGRYTAELVKQLTSHDDDTVIPFMAWHSIRKVRSVLRRFDLDDMDSERAVRLPLPRPLLVDAWNMLGVAGPQSFSHAVSSADLVHAPFLAVPPVRDVPLVVTFHDAGVTLFPDSYPRRGRRFHLQGARQASRRARLVLTPSHAAANEIATHTPIDAAKLRVVPHGVDQRPAEPTVTERVLATRGLTGVPFVLWVGTLEPRKNVGVLVRAVTDLVRRDHSSLHLVLVGPPGWKDSGLLSHDDVARLGPRLHRLGAIGETELRSLYAAATVFAFPSLHEGFGLPVIEAMVQGTAVVCADIPALREVAGDAACIIDPGDVGAWTEAIETVVADDALRGKMGAAGTRRAAEFTWARTARKTRDVYQEASEG